MNSPKQPTVEDGSYCGDITPRETWEFLQRDADAVLIDVRTDAEFAYVGTPDLTSLGKKTEFISWMLFPGSKVNPDFVAQLTDMAPDRNLPVLFICRSGVRSRFAAAAATEVGYSSCYNVLEGFEGDRNPVGQRGTTGGWKVAGLPWSQE